MFVAVTDTGAASPTFLNIDIPLCPEMKTNPGAFTLVELLVVISLIGILAAILIPVIGSVRRNSNDASAISNLRQTAQANLLYAADNKGCLTPIWGFNGDETWQSRLLDYVYPAAQAMDANTKRNYLLTLRADPHYVMGVPDADISDPYKKSIGLNTYIAVPSSGTPRRMNTIERPVSIIMLCEMREQNAEVAILGNVSYRRVGTKAGVAFCDGSVRLVTASDLANTATLTTSLWRYQ